MAIYMTRNPPLPANSNTINTNLEGQYKYYQKVYTASGAAETIMLPWDSTGTNSVTIDVTSAGTAKLEYTDSPPDQVLSGGTVTWNDLIADGTVKAKIQFIGHVAIRMNLTSGNWRISVAV